MSTIIIIIIILLIEGGGGLFICPLLEQKDDVQIASSVHDAIWKEICSVFNAWFYRSVWPRNALLNVHSKLLSCSRNSPNVWNPPEHFSIIGKVHTCSDILPLDITVLHKTNHSKQLPVGLSVFSDDELHFLKIENKFYQDYLVT